MSKILRLVFGLLMLAGLSPLAYGQGVTTAAINGTVTDSKGEALEGATVVVTHVPSGSVYGAVTSAKGRYNLPNIRVGGPYTVKVTYTGQQDQTQTIDEIDLGQNLTQNFTMTEGAVTTEEVVVSGAKDPVLNSGRTGAASNFNRNTIERMPTINRSFADITRLTPQSNGSNSQISFLGRSYLYNNITLDGAVFNNNFGLSGTLGGQTAQQPISLDALDQIQVSTSPYDVRQGNFTGAGINAVTRSGTNEFQASVYDFVRTGKYTGQNTAGNHIAFQPLNDEQFGFRIGGPIIKNRAFFFVSMERENRKDPVTTFTASTPDNPYIPNSSTSALPTADQLNAIASALQTKFGYTVGPYQGYNKLTHSDKAAVRLDFNINQNNKLNFKYNYFRSYADQTPSSSGLGATNGSRSPSQFTLPFHDAFYRINNDLNSFLGELTSTIGSRYSNDFIVGYTSIRDYRSSFSNPPFPLVDVLNGNTGARELTAFGYEPFTAGNKLYNNVFQIHDNFTAYIGNHSITVGAEYQYQAFENGFLPFANGRYTFASDKDLLANLTHTPSDTAFRYPTSYTQGYVLNGSGVPPVKMQTSTTSFYAQDEWNATKSLKVTYGIRVDIPNVLNTPIDNAAADNLVFNGQNYKTNKLMSATPLFAPRVGFNWDPKGDRSTQVRGGTGIFTGQIPYVWLSNQFSNTGAFSNTFTNSFDPKTGASGGNPNLPGYLLTNSVTAYIPTNRSTPGSYNLVQTDPNFKFPQVWRTDFAVDQKLPFGFIGTIEATVTKDINAIVLSNLNLAAPLGTSKGVDNRPIWYNIPAGGLTGPVYNVPVDPVNNPNVANPAANAFPNIYPQIPTAGNSGGDILLSNSSKPWAASVTAQLQRNFGSNFSINAFYTFTQAQDIFSGNNSIANSGYIAVPGTGNPNSPALGNSDFLVKQRLVMALSYRKEFANHFALTATIYSNAVTGFGSSFTYAGDMNGDGISGNELMYIPAKQSDINFTPAATAQAQWNTLDQLIKNNPYLRDHRGQYASRNAAFTPWYLRQDLRVLLDIFTNVGGKRNTVQLSLDVFNFPNLIYKYWGTQKVWAQTQPLVFKGYDGTGVPLFTLNNNLTTSAYTLSTSDITNRFQLQLGIRYIFN